MELFDELLGKLEETGLADKSGALLYSSIKTLSPGPLYLLGYNPGGDPEEETKTVRAHLESIRGNLDWNEFISEKWTVRNKIRPPGEAPMQRRVQDLLAGVGLKTKEVSASNLIFVRSRVSGDLDQANRLAIKCWPVHEFILAQVKPKAVLSIGLAAFDFVIKLAKPLSIAEPFPSGKGKYYCRAARIRVEGLDVNLVSVPHLGERVAYDITEYPDALEWVKTKLALGEIEGDA
jgi:hypothetical protein